MAKFYATPNYLFATQGENHYIKVLAEDRWRDCVGVPELIDGDVARKLDEDFNRQKATEWIGKVRKANPELDGALKKLELEERLEKLKAAKEPDEEAVAALEAELAEMS